MDELGWSDELTDLSSSDHDSDDAPAIPAAASTRNARLSTRTQKAPYTIREQLRPYRNTQYTAESLYQQLLDGSIDVDPDYQRDVVWTDAKQSNLIDSVFRNYYIPPIVFAVTYHEDGTESRVCIDGKQRLTSMKRFIDAEISYKDSTTDERLWSRKPEGKVLARKILPKPLMQQFLKKQIVCVEYHDLTENQEREIFQRVQLGVPLTPAERMQAINGPWPTFVRELITLITHGSDGFTDWNTERGRGFQSVAAVVVLAERYPKRGAFPGPVALEKMLARPQPVTARLRTGMRDVARAFVLLTASPAGVCLRRPARLSPVEFVMAALLVYVHRETMGVVRLGAAIAQLRFRVRTRFESELKCNTQVMRSALDFIAKIVPEDFGSDGAGDVPIAKLLAQREPKEVVEPEIRASSKSKREQCAQGKVVPAKAVSALKRKRAVLDTSDQDADSEDGSSKPLKRSPTNHKKVIKSASSASGLKTPSRAAQKMAAADSENEDEPKTSPSGRKKAVKPAVSAAAGCKTPSRTSKAAQTAKAGISKSTSAPIASSSKIAMNPPPTRTASISSIKPALASLHTANSRASPATGSSASNSPIIPTARPPFKFMKLDPAARAGGPPSTTRVSPPAGPPSAAGGDGLSAIRALCTPSASPALSPSIPAKTLDPRTRPPPAAAPDDRAVSPSHLRPAPAPAFALALAFVPVPSPSVEQGADTGWLQTLYSRAQVPLPRPLTPAPMEVDPPAAAQGPAQAKSTAAPSPAMQPLFPDAQPVARGVPVQQSCASQQPVPPLRVDVPTATTTSQTSPRAPSFPSAQMNSTASSTSARYHPHTHVSSAGVTHEPPRSAPPTANSFQTPSRTAAVFTTGAGAGVHRPTVPMGRPHDVRLMSASSSASRGDPRERDAHYARRSEGRDGGTGRRPPAPFTTSPSAAAPRGARAYPATSSRH